MPLFNAPQPPKRDWVMTISGLLATVAGVGALVFAALTYIKN